MTDKETIAKLTAEIARLQAALPRAWEMGRDDAAGKAKLVVCYQHGPYTEAGHMWSLGNLAYTEAVSIPVPADLAARIGGAQ